MDSFDEMLWKRAESKESFESPRMRMAEAVMRDIVVPGRSKAYVLETLGAPETAASRECWYFLGVASTSISATYLIVVFDANNLVSSSYLTRK